MSPLAPGAVGLGLRPPYFAAFAAGDVPVDFVEVISENVLGPAAPPRRVLRDTARHYPVILHGVGMNLLGPAPLDERYLDALARLADETDAVFVTDHLCWTGTAAACHHDLLPFPARRDLVDFAAERVAYAARRIGRPFGVEHISAYVRFRDADMRDGAFTAAVARAAGCGVVLDVNNAYVNECNNNESARDFLDDLTGVRVLYIHTAGHAPPDHGLRIDTHDRDVDSAVWSLLSEARARFGPVPAMIERDDHPPPLPALLNEVERLRAVP